MPQSLASMFLLQLSLAQNQNPVTDAVDKLTNLLQNSNIQSGTGGTPNIGSGSSSSSSLGNVPSGLPVNVPSLAGNSSAGDLNTSLTNTTIPRKSSTSDSSQLRAVQVLTTLGVLLLQ